MPYISLHKLEPGMVPTQDLLGKDGRVLVVKKTPLSKAHIRILKIWGVGRICIEEREQDFPETIAKAGGQETSELQNPELLKRAEKMLLPRFAQTDLRHPAVNKMFELAKHSLVGELSRNPDLVLAPAKRAQTRRHGEILFGKYQQEREPADEQCIGLISPRLEPLPGIVFRLQEALIDPKCSAITLAKIVNQDPNLARRLLKLINSPFYNLPCRINSIFEALTILGTKQVSMLVLAQTVRSVFKQIMPQDVDMNKFWRHSMACAIAARSLGAVKGKMNTERLFLAGMLHDVGKIILMDRFPEKLSQARKKAGQNRMITHVIETETIGVDHAYLGGMLLAEWKFSLLLEHAVRYHHNPEQALNLLDTAVLHTADVLAHACSIGRDSSECVPPLDARSWEVLDLEPAVLAFCAQQLEHFFAKGPPSRTDNGGQ